jgi:hypothetical protein
MSKVVGAYLAQKLRMRDTQLQFPILIHGLDLDLVQAQFTIRLIVQERKQGLENNPQSQYPA